MSPDTSHIYHQILYMLYVGKVLCGFLPGSWQPMVVEDCVLLRCWFEMNLTDASSELRLGHGLQGFSG